MADPIIPSYELSRGDDLTLPFRLMQLDRSDGSYNSSQPHRHNYYEIFYFVKGGGEHDIDFRTFSIRDGSLHFVIPGQVHQVRRDADSHGYIILFTAEFYMLGLRNREVLLEIPFMEHVSACPVLEPDNAERSALEGIFGMIQAEANSGREYGEDLLRSYLNVLLVHALRIYDRVAPRAPAPDTDHEIVNRLRASIERHFIAEHSPSAYAEMLNVSQNHLNTLVRQMLGRTIGDLIHERLILEARRLLFHTDASIKEVAWGLNFDDPSYFSRFFRKHAGCTPQEFRDEGKRQKEEGRN